MGERKQVIKFDAGSLGVLLFKINGSIYYPGIGKVKNCCQKTKIRVCLVCSMHDLLCELYLGMSKV